MYTLKTICHCLQNTTKKRLTHHWGSALRTNLTLIRIYGSQKFASTRPAASTRVRSNGLATDGNVCYTLLDRLNRADDTRPLPALPNLLDTPVRVSWSKLPKLDLLLSSVSYLLSPIFCLLYLVLIV